MTQVNKYLKAVNIKDQYKNTIKPKPFEQWEKKIKINNNIKKESTNNRRHVLIIEEYPSPSVLHH